MKSATVKKEAGAASKVDDKKKPPAKPNLSALERIDRLRWLLHQQERAYDLALAAASYIAAGKCLKEIERILEEIGKEERAREAETLSEEAYLQRLSDLARSLPVQHLEPFVEEFLARHPGVRLVRRAA